MKKKTGKANVVKTSAAEPAAKAPGAVAELVKFYDALVLKYGKGEAHAALMGLVLSLETRGSS